MSSNQYPSDVQFAGLIQAATAAADAQERNASILGKRRRDQDDSLIDTQLRAQSNETPQNVDPPPSGGSILQNSATVLFREPSEASKKYSRPPLGKVYADLQLAPESFLRLQNAAKLFMLDENHMERRDVVGHKKHSGNNDVAKLRLWSCVEQFLSEDNNGDQWFGHNAGVDIPESPQRTFFWPEDRQKITKLCMPLFRKMVTNERQRIYASETRKQDPSKQDKNKKQTIDLTEDDESSALPAVSSDKTSGADNNLDNTNVNSGMFSIDAVQQPSLDTTGQVKLRVSIVSNNAGAQHRVAPRFDLTSDAVPTLAALVVEAHKKYDSIQPLSSISEDDKVSPVIKVWLPDGLVRIKNDGQWMVALLSASMVDWMDSEVTVLIEVASTSEMATV